MPDFKFYFTDEDRIKLVKHLEDDGGRFIADTLLETNAYHVINSDIFLETQMRSTSHFFLINDQFTFEPLLLEKSKYSKEERYFIVQRKGGPYIDFSFYRGFAEGDVIPYKRSEISLYPKFIHYNSYLEYKPSEELKKYYNGIVKFIKTQCEVVKRENKKYWVSKRILNDV